MNMKCNACGYEYEVEIGNKYIDTKIIKGDKAFIETSIQCKIALVDDCLYFGGYLKNPIEVDEKIVYACPKCGTLKIEV